MTSTLSNTVHDNVITGNTHRNVRIRESLCGGGGGTLWSFMFGSAVLFSVTMMSSTGNAFRAAWAFLLAIVALWIIDRLKPATPRKPIPVRVHHSATPLYSPPPPQQKRSALARLAGGAIVIGALLAIAVAFLGAITLDIMSGLLGG